MNRDENYLSDNNLNFENNKILMGIGAQIEKIRFTRGYKRSDLAVKLGVSLAQITDIENGKHNPSFKRIDQIAEILNIPTDYLFVKVHDEFILYAIDGYLKRIRTDTLIKLFSDLLSLIGITVESYPNIYYTIEAIFAEVSEKRNKVSYMSRKQKLKSYRKEMKLVQSQIAQLIGMTYDHYVKYENDLTGISLSNHLRVCLAFGKSSECIEREDRSDMMLTKLQMDSLRCLEKEKLNMLLEILKAIYENSLS